jgi:uncharacterized protein
MTGPRQSGKTTLVRATFPQKAYANLEQLEARTLAITDPRAFLSHYPNGAILDEIQRAPDLLSDIQVIVDEREEKGLFILTGSHQFELHQTVTQSLAGRTALLSLFPLSLAELAAAGIDLSLDDCLLMGGYPRIFKDRLDPTKTYRNYFETYVERDLRQLIQITNLLQFEKFVRLCAGRVGQILHLASLSNDTGVSSPTIRHWLSILEASFLIFRLPPYYENFGKRIIKAPKLYFTDVGLASYLLGIETVTQMARDPLRGALVENLVVNELLKSRCNRGLDPRLYYFRDSHGHEVDVVFQSGRELVPIEIKAAQTFQSDHLKNLHFFKNLVGDRCLGGSLIYTGSTEQSVQGFALRSFWNAHRALTTTAEAS